MPVFSSQIDVHNDVFQERYQALLQAIEHFRSLEQAIVDKSNRAAAKFKKRGQLLPRQRIELLLDPGRPM